MVAYTSRAGNETVEAFRRRIYDLFINKRLVPAPEYTVSNFFSRFCVCESCGEGPRISLYSWSFLPKVQRALSPYEMWPPVFHGKCRDCALSSLYEWIEYGNRICIVNDCSELYNTGDEEDEYASFMVIRWRPCYSKYSSSHRCLFCRKDVTEVDKVVGVIVNDEVYKMADTYHVGCFFSQFAFWMDCGQMTAEEQTFPVFGVA